MVSYSHFGIEGSNGQSRREGRRAWRLGAGVVCGLALGLLAASWVEARPGLVVQPTRVDVDEADAEGSTYTVALREQPSEDVTVVGAEGRQLTVAPSQLTFTAEDWAAARTVRVTAGTDPDARSDQVQLRHTGSGAGYVNLVLPSVFVLVKDDDRNG